LSLRTLRLPFAFFAAVLFAALAAPAGTAAAPQEKAVFAGGCFWCEESAFEGLPGVSEVVSGYTGGTVANPTYEEVSSGRTGHAESAEVTFDPAKISYEKLLDVYWHNIDPTQVDGQFCDHGSQYRTAIFYMNDAQKRAAEASKAKLDQDPRFRGKIATQIVPAAKFYPAEAYHQNYAALHPDNPYIAINDAPKVTHLRELFPQLYRSS